MITKPLYLRLFPLFSLMIAISFPLQVFFIYDIQLSNLGRVFSMLTPLNLLSMGVLIASCLLTISMSKAIYKVVPILLALLFVNNAIVGLYGTDFTLVQVGLGFVLMALSLKPFYSSQIKMVIMNPKLRWWETPKRYNVKKALTIKFNDFEIFSESTNLSKNGLFTKINEDGILELLELNDVVKVGIIGESNVQVEARIVRKNNDLNSNPGLGLEIIKNKDHSDTYVPWFKQMVA